MTPRPRPTRTARLCAGLAALCAGAPAAVAEPAPATQPQAVEHAPIVVSAIERSTDAGPLRGWIATIDLADPRVDIVVTGPHAGEPFSPDHETTLQTVEDWAQESGVVLAVNTNFFAWLGPRDQHGAGGPAGVVGWLVTDGVQVSPPRKHEGRWDPVLAFDREGQATIARGRPDGAWDAVAGVGGSSSDATPGTLLIEEGKLQAESARVAPLDRHPRTAAGLSEDRQTLLLLVIDGRQPGWSLGATLPETARVLADHGAHWALNLDGGGSTTLWYDPDGPGGHDPTINRFSDKTGMRAVAAHLGVALSHDPLAEAAP